MREIQNLKEEPAFFFIINKIEKLAQKEEEDQTSFVIYLAWNCETKRGHVAEWNPILG